MKIEVSATIDLKDTLSDLDCFQALAAIEAVDLGQADTDFTKSVIEKLVESLVYDAGRSDLRKFLKDLRKKLK